MIDEVALIHGLIALPPGKAARDVVAERHDMVLLFDASKANPNGDPDAANMPRLLPDTLKGLVTDVCLKRKIRNFFSLYAPDGTPVNGRLAEGYRIFIRENAVLQESMEGEENGVPDCAKAIFDTYDNPEKIKWEKPSKGKASKHELVQRAYRDALCKTFFDVRTFGGVVSTKGPLKDSFFGQIRGPMQFTFAESLDRVLQLDATITRCAVASPKARKQADGDSSQETEEAGNRTIGRKHFISYGLYRAHIYFSPAFAVKTRFSYYDLDNFLFALTHLFTNDASAARAGVRVVGLVDFQHATPLGNEHAHKLFKMVEVERTPESRNREFPESLEDYWGAAPEGAVRQVKENGAHKALVTARPIVWDIPKRAPSASESA